MTNENIIEIKKQRKNWFVKGFLYLSLMICALYVALMPLISEFAKKNSGIFYVAGFSLFTIFVFMFIFNIYKTCKPENAIILSAHSFIDRINVGDNIEIEWTNVAAVKTLGKSNTPYLGVTLENTDIILSKMKNNLAAEMRENIEQNLPTILIPQSKVKIPIKDLKDTFAKFAREARVLQRDSQQKSKNNPFSTDDVLRAFGKLPKEQTKEEEEEENTLETPDITLNVENDDNSDNLEVADFNTDANEEVATEAQEIIPEIPSLTPETQDNISQKLSSPFEIPDDIIPQQNGDGERKRSASDSFYEALRSKTIAKNISNESENTKNKIDSKETKDNCSDSSCDTAVDMPEEIKEILNRAKSSRISQIEEILCKDDIPYSLSRKNNSLEINNATDAESYEDSAFADEINIGEFDPSEEVKDTDLNFQIDDALKEENEQTIAAPSIDKLFNEVIENKEHENIVDIDLSDVIKEHSEALEDAPISSLDSLIENALNLSANTNNPVVDDSLGDTKEFIIPN